MTTDKKRCLLWFRGTDLRLHDNPVVNQATKLASTGADVLPVYCYDPRFFSPTPMGDVRTGRHRAQFLLESVADLRRSLQALGTDLVVLVGHPEQLLPRLAEGSTAPVVISTSEVTSEEHRIDRKVNSAMKTRHKGASMQLLWGTTLYHEDDVPFDASLNDLPDVFTPFRNKVESRCTVRKALPAPAKGQLGGLPALPADVPVFDGRTLEALGEALGGVQFGGEHEGNEGSVKGVLDFRGGETAALQRLKYYLWDTDLIANYFETRNGMLGGDYSTKFAPWLALGCLSPRTVYHEIKRYEAQRTANKSTYWVIFELIWRDFFKFFALKHGNRIFFQEGVVPRGGAKWRSDADAFARWRDGKTGWPLVDANMRELKATGFMSNRGRQNVASFLALDLDLDWRDGAWWFESCLLDYDVASNWGNWVAAAGLTGGRLNKFNITKQSKDYDPQGEYIRHWIPELAKVPTSRIHEPWLMSREEQVASGCEIGVHYPQPLKSVFRFGGDGGGRGGNGGRGKYATRGDSGGYRKSGGRGSKGGRSRAPSNWEMFG